MLPLFLMKNRINLSDYFNKPDVDERANTRGGGGREICGNGAVLSADLIQLQALSMLMSGLASALAS